MAREWSHQVLAAPWWWRLTRVLMFGAVAVLGCASVLVVALDGKDESVMAHYSLLTVLPVLAASAWWQTRCARRLVVQTGATTTAFTRVDGRASDCVRCCRWCSDHADRSGAVVESQLRVPCPAVTIDQDVLNYTEDVAECPWADTAVGITGFRHTPIGDRTVCDHVYAIPGLGTLVIPDDMGRAWHAQLKDLGAPIDFPHPDAQTWFLNFERGHIAHGSG
ncbi:hypothetical protein [Lentzea atacamensis]|uniref:hypothetical protein n=1 Tax=Lentzea atacamensis TaxID=531938 RepID=UPI0011B36F7B|nr:hypothetical protein [Lentzea atacamensis]